MLFAGTKKECKDNIGRISKEEVPYYKESKNYRIWIGLTYEYKDAIIGRFVFSLLFIVIIFCVFVIVSHEKKLEESTKTSHPAKNIRIDDDGEYHFIVIKAVGIKSYSDMDDGFDFTLRRESINEPLFEVITRNGSSGIPVLRVPYNYEFVFFDD